MTLKIKFKGGIRKKQPSTLPSYTYNYVKTHDYTDHGLDLMNEFVRLSKRLRITPYYWDNLYRDVWIEQHPYNGELNQFLNYTVNRYLYKKMTIEDERPVWLYKLKVLLYKVARRVNK